MADEAIYRCINEACGRPAPRPVHYCPWCGTAQDAAAARRPAAAAATASAAAVGASAAPAAAMPAAPLGANEFGRTGKGSALPPSAPQPAATPAGAASANAAAANAAAAGAAQAPQQQEVPRPPLAPRPPERRPIRLRWWLLLLALLWAAWLVAKPSAKKIERRIDAAIALAHACKGSEAQDELIALRKSNATPEQLQRLQAALNDEAAICTRRRQRAKAWSETSGAIDTALAAASWDKAKTRLQAFIRRWGEDDQTRALQLRIEDLRREDEARRSHPLAVPPATQGEGINP